MDRRDKIDRMLKAVDDWDLEILVDFAQVKLEQSFNDMTDEQIHDEYREWFDEEEDEECVASSVGVVSDSSGEARCTCDLNTLMSQGCVCGGK